MFAKVKTLKKKIGKIGNIEINTMNHVQFYIFVLEMQVHNTK